MSHNRIFPVSYNIEENSGRGSHIDMVYVYVPAFWGAFSRNLVYRLGVFIRDEGAQIQKLVYFEKTIVKSIKFGQNLMLFYPKWYTHGWVICQKNWYKESQLFKVRQADPRTILGRVFLRGNSCVDYCSLLL